MGKPWILTRQAEHSLVEIAAWTVETFGKRQADAYAEELIATCRALADGQAPSGDCRRLVATDLPEDLRYARMGQHNIVFLVKQDRMIVVDFLQVRMDLPARLASFREPEA